MPILPFSGTLFSNRSRTKTTAFTLSPRAALPGRNSSINSGFPGRIVIATGPGRRILGSPLPGSIRTLNSFRPASFFQGNPCSLPKEMLTVSPFCSFPRVTVKPSVIGPTIRSPSARPPFGSSPVSILKIRGFAHKGSISILRGVTNSANPGKPGSSIWGVVPREPCPAIQNLTVIPASIGVSPAV